MVSDDETRFQDWENNKVVELERFTPNFMLDQDDGKLFIFSGEGLI